MLLGRLRRTASADGEECSRPGNERPITPLVAPEVLEIVVEPRRFRRRAQGQSSGSCVCCTCGLLVLIVFAVFARQVIAGMEADAMQRLRGSNETPVSANITENVSSAIDKENATDTIGLPHGDSLWPHREGQWNSEVLETDDNLSNESVEDQIWHSELSDWMNDSSAEGMDSPDANETLEWLNRSDLPNVNATDAMHGWNESAVTTTSRWQEVSAGEVNVSWENESGDAVWNEVTPNISDADFFAITEPKNESTDASNGSNGIANLTLAGDDRWTGSPGTMTSSTSFSMTELSGSTLMNVSNVTLTTTLATSSLFAEVSTGSFGAGNGSWTMTTTSGTSRFKDVGIIGTNRTDGARNITATSTSTSSWTFAPTGSGRLPGFTLNFSTTTTETSTWWPRSTTYTTTTSTMTVTTTATTTSFRHPEFQFHASGPLQTMPNCFLAPLVEKPGCRRVSVEEGDRFSLNELGQETTARRHCLERARRDQGNTWVFRVGRCEVWNCTSKETLWRSADSGPPFGGFFVEDSRGRLLTTGKKHEVVAEDSYIASLALALHESDVQLGRGKLRSADGHYVTSTFGMLEATGHWESGETYNITQKGGGMVSLHGSGGSLRCGAAGRCVVSDSGEDDPMEGLFRLVPSRKLRETWSKNHSNISGRAWVHSILCNYQEPYGGEGGRQRRSASYVKLWEWNYVDVKLECRDFLGPAGVDAVQVSPVTEHILGHQWWVRYQPISASLTSRSGTGEQLKEAVAECRKAGVDVIVDVVLNHMARPCPAASKSKMPCVGWNGTAYGNRRTAGARGWDMATPQHFHHGEKELWGACGVGPDTGFLCGSSVTTDCSCCPCDMYGLPDWDLAVKAVQESHTRHLEELHRMGVTMLRIDAALYVESELMSSILNRFPWDVVYQEWWHELPYAGRTHVFGLYRDLKLMRRIAEFLDVLDISRTGEVLDVDRGDFYIHSDEAIYPTCFHDGRTDNAEPAIPTFKNGLAFHQQQLFMLASPFPVTVVLWGGYAWHSIDDGPPGCEAGQALSHRCVATSPHRDGCLATPTASPLEELPEPRSWICEHRWQGVAGLIRFRNACRDGITERWTSGGGHVAFRLGSSCFVALARGSEWILSSSTVSTGLPKGHYCDLASYDGRTCHRWVLLDSGGVVLEGGVAAGGLLAISASVALMSPPSQGDYLPP